MTSFLSNNNDLLISPPSDKKDILFQNSLMKVLVQLSLIMAICLLGELMSSIVPFPLPGTIIALLILFILLKSKVIKLSWVEDAGNLLLKNMSLLFVPVGVKIMAYFGIIKDIWWKLLLLCIAATILSFFATALVVSLIMKITKKGEKA